MPPKAKFTRDEIAAAALEIVRTKGLEALSARQLGSKLESSARPIFTIYKNMEELQQEMLILARKLYRSYVEEGLCKTAAFRGVGQAYIRFAQEEPKLFQLLFMTEQKQPLSLNNVLPEIEESYTEILSSVSSLYSLNEAQSITFYQHLWIYTHGVATLCATQVCLFKPEEIESMLMEVSKGLIHQLKEKNDD